jgi:hypothetical protein
MPFSRGTPEEKAARDTEKQAERARNDANKQSEKEAKARAKLRDAFFKSPTGEARAAFEAGAHVFQYEASVKSMTAVVKPIGFGSSAIGKLSAIGRGPVATLNSVCDEGRELINGSFVFVETGQVSRNKALSTGQQVATSGSVVGCYLFKRNESNKKNLPDPWDAPTEEAVQLADQVENE